MKKILSAIIISVLLFSCAHHPALKIFSWYADVADTNFIIPYTLNLFAIQKMDDKQNQKYIKNYIEWTFTKLNYPDRHGLTGSIYDFHISREGKEMPTTTYDSVDSYSATFLILLNKYLQKTGDKDFLASFRTKIEDIAYTIVYLQADDGLTSAIPNSETKYLMDNCEVYAGLVAFANLSESMGWNLENYYRNVAIAIKNGIFNFFYNPELNNFNWAIDELGVHTSDWNVFYPDAFAQLFPIVYKLVDDQPLIKNHLWQKFNSLYKNKKNVPLEQKLVITIAEERMGK